MKLQDFDFRVWDISKKRFYNDLELSMLPADNFKNTFNINLAIIFARNLENASMFGDNYEFELFTGYQDKNGTKIYEGDILKCWNDNHYEGKDDPYASGSVAIPLAENEKKYDFFAIVFDKELGFVSTDLLALNYIIDDYDCVEVVGNIHENHELIKDNE